MKNTILVNGNNKKGLVEGLVKKVVAERTDVRRGLQMDIDFVGAALASVLNNSNKGIGQITYWNNTQIAMLFNKEIAKLAINNLDFLKNVNKGIGKYKRFKKENRTLDDKNISVVKITQADVDKMIENIKLSNLDDEENLKNILLDLNIVYRMYQEKTIDAAKKAIEVAIKIALDKYKALSLVHLDYEFDWNTKEFKVKRLINPNSDVEIFTDKMSLIQDKATDLLSEIVGSLVEETPKLSEDDKYRIINEPALQDIKYDAYKIIKSTYGAISGDLAQMKELANSLMSVDKDEAERISTQASAIYKERIDVLNMVAYTMLKDYPADVRTNILQYIAYTDKNEVFDENSLSKLPFTILAEETLDMILKNHATQKKAGYKILIAKEDIVEGDYVFFEDGITEAGSYADFGKDVEYATDFYEISKIDGQFYATRDIEFNTNRGNNIAFAVQDAIVEAFVPGCKITIANNGVIKTEGITVGKVRGNNGSYLSKITNKTGVITKIVNVESSEHQYKNFLVEITDVEDLEIEVIDDNEIAELIDPELDELINDIPEMENFDFDNKDIPEMENFDFDNVEDIEDDSEDSDIPTIEDFEF